MELRDAVDQIASIRTHLAATERLRSLRAVPVALSGLLALLAAALQALQVPEPLRAPGQYLLLWLGVAAISTLAAGLELLRRVRGSHSGLGAANAVVALQQFAPCLLAGAIATAGIAARVDGPLWLLPGLWQLFFGLGVLAAHRLLPPGAFAVGAGYLCCGALTTSFGERALSPWAMGLPFALGQGVLAAMLWWHHERACAEVRR